MALNASGVSWLVPKHGALPDTPVKWLNSTQTLLIYPHLILYASMKFSIFRVPRRRFPRIHKFKDLEIPH